MDGGVVGGEDRIMPACFQLFKKESDVPARFCDVDDEMCKAFGIEPDVKMYLYGWYDSIGFLIAVGHELGGESLREKIKEYDYGEGRLTKALAWLEENYSSSAWYERKGF